MKYGGDNKISGVRFKVINLHIKIAQCCIGWLFVMFYDSCITELEISRYGVFKDNVILFFLQD